MALREVARAEEVHADREATADFWDAYLGWLLASLERRHGAGVVFLIDDYDAPMADHADRPSLARANGQFLRAFFKALKKFYERLHLVLVTGVTRFVLAPEEPAPDNVYGLSLRPEFAGACGFTVSEFDRLFGTAWTGPSRASKPAAALSRTPARAI
jgi:hypothetical protein